MPRRNVGLWLDAAKNHVTIVSGKDEIGIAVAKKRGDVLCSFLTTNLDREFPLHLEETLYTAFVEATKDIKVCFVATDVAPSLERVAYEAALGMMDNPNCVWR